jgi:aminoglycoside phosphotransferase (APT) family kinase protein
LVASQFPRWADLPVTEVEPGGWDNRTFRLGREMSVRLPSAGRYAHQAEKEHRWLPRLAPHLPLPIPIPLAMGDPAEGYPWRWSVCRWLEGESADTARMDDPCQIATSLAGFLVALRQIDPRGGPPPGDHNFFRGGSIETYDAETRQAIASLQGMIGTEAATAVWHDALDATWRGTPVWLHGDVSPGNLLLRDGRLGAVIDFGSCGVGDPACDLAIAWTLFQGDSREAFRAEMQPDDETWARGRGWALWKALITLAGHGGTDPAEKEGAGRVVEEILAGHGSRGPKR